MTGCITGNMTSTLQQRRADATIRFNSFAATLPVLEARLHALRAQRTALLAGLDWHERFDPVAADNARVAKMCEATILHFTVIEPACQQLEQLRTQVEQGKRAEGDLGLFARINGTRARVLASNESLERELRELDLRRAEATARHTMLVAQYSSVYAELVRYSEFDVAAVHTSVVATEEAMVALANQYAQVNEDKMRVDLALQDNLDALVQTELKIETIERDIARAEELQHELDATEKHDRRKRALIHMRCLEELGNAKPSGTITSNRSRLPKLMAERDKLEKRLRLEAAWASRSIRRIVIDGSNLCFAGNAPIGLNALDALVPCLAAQYEILVVFDPDIGRKLGMTRQQIRKHLERPGVLVSFSHGQADETVVELALEPGVYIISNDNFREHQHRPPVAEGRVIPHEILGGRVMIHPLRVNIPYEDANSVQPTRP